MKKIFQYTIAMFLFVGMAYTAHSQVVMSGFLESNHSGMIENSVNNDGNTLYYEWEFLDKETNMNKDKELSLILFKLHLAKDKEGKDLILSLDVSMRDLLVTFYIDVLFDKDEHPKAAAMRYKKDNRWALVKFVPHPGCKIESGQWERMNDIESFDQLLQYVVKELDNNVDFSCFTGQGS